VSMCVSCMVLCVDVLVAHVMVCVDVL
jgi:hypothetical protein